MIKTFNIHNIISKEEKDRLYTSIFHLLGMPVRGVELTEDQMDSFFELALNQYEQIVNDWLIESQWSSLVGLNVDTQSLTRAFTTRSFDYETQFTYAYSKIVGLQTNGPWILKKDFITLERNQQIYEIPANREVNELLWFSRSELNDVMYNNIFGSTFMGVGLGNAQLGNNHIGGHFITPSFDLLLRMQDRNLKNRIFNGELTYRITATEGGKKLIHLYNVPGGNFDFNNINRHCKVWYWYYDTADADRDKCLEENKDIVKLPSDVATSPLKWGDLNGPSQNWVRNYLITYAKEGLARIWGKFSGDIQVPDNPAKLDYTTLLTEAKDERSKLLDDLNQRLERLRPEKILERKGMEAENLNKSLKYRPFKTPFTVI